MQDLDFSLVKNFSLEKRVRKGNEKKKKKKKKKKKSSITRAYRFACIALMLASSC